MIILKLIANNDNPSRTKDITDIEHFLEMYFELNSNEIYTRYLTVMELYDTGSNEYLSLVSARIVGRKMSAMLTAYDDTISNIKIILAKRSIATWQAMLDGMND